MRALTLILGCLLGTTAQAGTTVKSINQTIDYSLTESISEQILEFHGKFADTDYVVYLNLTILPADHESADYRVTGIDKTGKASKIACDGFERIKPEYGSYNFVFNPDYNHLLLSIIGEPSAKFPFMTVACEYNGAQPSIWQMRFSGYFAVSTIGIPAAEDVELRPVTPIIGG